MDKVFAVISFVLICLLISFCYNAMTGNIEALKGNVEAIMYTLSLMMVFAVAVKGGKKWIE